MRAASRVPDVLPYVNSQLVTSSGNSRNKGLSEYNGPDCTQKLEETHKNTIQERTHGTPQEKQTRGSSRRKFRMKVTLLYLSTSLRGRARIFTSREGRLSLGN